MGTHAIVARPTPDGFTGRIILLDGSPDTAVPILLDLAANVHAGDVAATVGHLIDDHPGGWVQLPASDSPQGECLCHDSPPSNEPASTAPVTHDHTGETQFAYVLHPDRIAVHTPGEIPWPQIAVHPWTD